MAIPNPLRPDPDAPITFRAYVKDMRANQRDGELTFTVAVPIEFKYDAMPATDHPGRMFEFVVTPYDPSINTDNQDGDGGWSS